MINQDMKPHELSLQFAITAHSAAMNYLQNYEISGHLHRQQIKNAREAHQQFRKWKKTAIQQAEQFATDAEFDTLLDRLDKLPSISPASLLLNQLTGDAA